MYFSSSLLLFGTECTRHSWIIYWDISSQISSPKMVESFLSPIDTSEKIADIWSAFVVKIPGSLNTSPSILYPTGVCAASLEPWAVCCRLVKERISLHCSPPNSERSRRFHRSAAQPHSPTGTGTSPGASAWTSPALDLDDKIRKHYTLIAIVLYNYWVFNSNAHTYWRVWSCSETLLEWPKLAKRCTGEHLVWVLCPQCKHDSGLMRHTGKTLDLQDLLEDTNNHIRNTNLKYIL